MQRHIKSKLARVTTAAISLAAISGCSATSLRCGVDGDSSFVELYGAPQHMSQNTRQFGELCGFAYVGEENDET